MSLNAVVLHTVGYMRASLQPQIRQPSCIGGFVIRFDLLDVVACGQYDGKSVSEHLLVLKKGT